MILYILIIFFIILIVYQILLGVNQTNIEGMTDSSTTDTSTSTSTDTSTSTSSASTPQYTDYSTTGVDVSNIIAQQNAGNITVLKKQTDQLTSSYSITEQDMSKMQKQVDDMQNQLLTIQQQQQQFAIQMQSMSKSDSTTSTTSSTSPTTSTTTTSST
jgi:septation ring formation regulator EzrA